MDTDDRRLAPAARALEPRLPDGIGLPATGLPDCRDLLVADTRDMFMEADLEEALLLLTIDLSSSS